MINLNTVKTFIAISQEAEQEIQRQLKLMKKKGIGVRIYVILDKFAGFAYDLEFDFPDKNNDTVVKVDGINLIVDKGSLDYVKGMKINYDIENKQFSLINEKPEYNCVPGSKYECPSCNLYEGMEDGIKL